MAQWQPGVATWIANGPNGIIKQVTFVGSLCGATYTGVVQFESQQLASDAVQMWSTNQYNLTICGDLTNAQNFQKVLNIVMTASTRTVRFWMQSP